MHSLITPEKFSPMRAASQRKGLAASGALPALSFLISTLLVDAALLLEIGILQLSDANLHAGFRSAQSIALLAVIGFGTLCVLASVGARRAAGSRVPIGVDAPNHWTIARWSLWLTFVLCTAVWMLWNYRVDGVLTWPDTEDYAQVAGESVLSAGFWAGGNPPGVALVFKAFGLTAEMLSDPRFGAVSRRVTQFQTILSLFAVGSLAFSFASLLRHRWLRAAAVMAVVGFGLSMDVAQWNKMLLSESLSTSLFFGLVAGAILAGRWWEGPRGPRRSHLLVVSAALTAGVILFAFTRDVNAYFLLALGVSLLPPIVASVLRRRRGWWAPACLVGVVLLASVTSVTVRRSQWSYPFINLIYERILPDAAAVDFYVQRDFPIEVIEEIRPQTRRDLHVAYRSDPRAEPLRTWFQARARSVHAEFLLSRPIDTLSAPLPRLEVMMSPDVSWYRNRLHAEPSWMPVASAIVYPRQPLVVLLWFGVILGFTTVLILSGRGRTVWAIPLLVLAMLYPLMLVIWHGDSAALERHSLPLALGLRLSLWLLSFLLLDAALDRRGSSVLGRNASAPGKRSTGVELSGEPLAAVGVRTTGNLAGPPGSAGGSNNMSLGASSPES